MGVVAVAGGKGGEREDAKGGATEAWLAWLSALGASWWGLRASPTPCTPDALPATYSRESLLTSFPLRISRRKIVFLGNLT